MNTTTLTTPINVILETSPSTPIPVSSVAPATSAQANLQARYASIYDQLTTLVADSKAWETTHLYVAHEALYLLLQRCYDLYITATNDAGYAAMLQAAIQDYFNLNGMKLDKASHTLNNIAKIVFGADRKRASAYALALRVALSDKTPVADLPQYFRNAGGCEEVRRKAKNPNGTTKTAEQKATEAKTWLASDNYGVFRNDVLALELDAAKVGEQHLLIVTQQLDGSFTVNGLISTAGVVQSALVAFYTKHKDDQTAQVAEKTETDATAALSTAIAAAADSVAN